ncbi:MAG: S1 RNA-binding domain-containing protein [Microcystaceae cyanobacterium]
MSDISFSHDEFAKALDDQSFNFNPGQVVKGKVVQHTSDGAYIDIGAKSPGFVSFREVSMEMDKNLAELLPLEAEFDFLIILGQNADGQVTLSRRQLAVKQAWDEMAEKAENGQSVQMRVTRTNRGGVIGEVGGLRGFIPRSHLIEKEDLESLIGQLLTATFLEVNPDTNKLVLSQRQAAQALAIQKVTQGSLMVGRVVKIQPYGVFVDLDGVTGLLHITQVSGTRIDALTTVFQIGQEIKVVILQIDEYKNRISLSTKILEDYPGEWLENAAKIIETAEERMEKVKDKLEEAEAKGNVSE